MYVPGHFSQDDTAVAQDLIRGHVFATLVTALEELGGESNMAVAATMRMLDQ